MWGIGVLAFLVLLLFVDWFAAIFLAGCVMGAYGVVLPFVYDGEWVRGEDGRTWQPKESGSSDHPGPPLHVIEKRGTLFRSIGHSLFPLIVVALLVYVAIEALVVRK
jgi:uncharacterized membrane protein YbhN (UPF0104 family)